MAASRFTAPNRADVVARIEAGASLGDAARAIGISPDTLKSWVRRGRKGEEPYDEFVEAIEAARVRHADQPPMSRAEFQKRLDAAVRSGSVAAMRLWHEVEKETRKPVIPRPASKIADLAERRRAQAR